MIDQVKDLLNEIDNNIDTNDLDFLSKKRIELATQRAYLGEEYAKANQSATKVWWMYKAEHKKASVAETDRSMEETEEFRKAKEIKYTLEGIDQVLHALKSRINVLMAEKEQSKEV